MKTLAIDIGGTFIKYGLIDEECHLSQKGKVPTPQDTHEHILEVLSGLYHQFDEDLEGIAISAPGRIDSKNGVMITGGALRYLDGFHLVENLKPLCDNKPISIENDAKAAALCESWIGSSKDCENSVVMIFGSGIGGGIVYKNDIIRGHQLIAGEFSPVFSDMRRDSYREMADDYSTLTVVKKVKETKDDESLTGEDLMRLYREGDEEVVSIVEDWFFAIAKYCYNIDNIINPDIICIGGGISEDPLFVEGIEKALVEIEKHAFTFRKPPITVCQYHNDSNLIGAYYTFKKTLH